MRRSPGLKAGCLFNGACIASFCSSKTSSHRIVDVVHCRRQCLQPHLFHVSKQPAVVYGAAMVSGVCENTKSPNTLFYLRKGGHMGATENTPPQTNGLGKYVLFPCIALYMNVSIDILKGNSFYIGV
jgi:hypothetical protein